MNKKVIELIQQKELLHPTNPVVFADGTSTFKIFEEEYEKQEENKPGFFIFGPSGVGKTHFIKNQKKKVWIDGDDLWMAAKAHPKGEWWLSTTEEIAKLDAMSDLITLQAKKLGLCIMGASNNWLRPDAIVIPPWDVHQRYIKHREENNYDGGAKSDALEQVQNHRNFALEWEKKGVPKFESVEEAVNFLTRKKQ